MEDPSCRATRQSAETGSIASIEGGVQIALTELGSPQELTEAQVAQLGGLTRDLPETDNRVIGAGIIHLGQQGKQRRSLHQGANGRAVVLALDGIALSVAGDKSIFYLGGALGDGNHVGNLTAPVLSASARAALLMVVAQQCDNFCSQLAAGHGIDGLIDGFVADRDGFQPGTHTLECTGNLLGRKAAAQVIHDDLPERSAGLQTALDAGLGGLAVGALLGLVGVIGNGWQRPALRLQGAEIAAAMKPNSN